MKINENEARGAPETALPPRNPSVRRPSGYYFVVIYPKGTKCNFKTPKGAFRQPPCHRGMPACADQAVLLRSNISQGNSVQLQDA